MILDHAIELFVFAIVIAALVTLLCLALRQVRREYRADPHPGLLPRETYDRMRDREHIIERQRDMTVNTREEPTWR